MTMKAATEGPTYSVGIVGLGNIGLLYDLESGPEVVMTHARAASSHPRTRLAWGCDTNVSRRASITEHYGAETFSDLNTALESSVPDILVIATPLGHRAEIWTNAIAAKPQVILSEKPLAETSARVSELTAEAQQAGVSLVVNYIRRFIPAAHRARQLIESDALGGLLAGNVLYAKGLNNNGAHLINLLTMLLGEPGEVSCASQTRQVPEVGDVDVDFIVAFSGIKIRFSPADYRRYALAEIDLVFERGRLRFDDHALSLTEWVGLKDAGVAGLSELNEPCQGAPTARNDYQLHVIDSLVAGLDSGERFDKEARDALFTTRVCEQALEESQR